MRNLHKCYIYIKNVRCIWGPHRRSKNTKSWWPATTHCEVNASKIHIKNSNVLHAEQKSDITCKKIASQSNHSNKNIFNTVIISADGILQKKQYIHGLKHNVTLAPCSIVPIILHKSKNSKGHRGIIHMFKVLRRSYWLLKLGQDVVKCIKKCDICAKNLPNMAKHQQKHLEIPQTPMAVLAMDTIGHFPVMSKGYRWALTAICLHTSYLFSLPMKENSAKNFVHAYS